MIIRQPRLYIGKLINNLGELHYGFPIESWKDVYQANRETVIASANLYLEADNRAMCSVYCTGSRGTIRIIMTEDYTVVRDETINGWPSFYATLISQSVQWGVWKTLRISIIPSENVELECMRYYTYGIFYPKDSTVNYPITIENCEDDISCYNTVSFIVFPNTSILPNPFDVEITISWNGDETIINANPFKESKLDWKPTPFIWTTQSPHIEWLKITDVRTGFTFNKHIDDTMILAAAVDEYQDSYYASGIFICPNIETALKWLPTLLIGYKLRTYFISLPMRAKGEYCVGINNLRYPGNQPIA